MKIILYDPLYSSIGHFHRYSSFLVEILSEMTFIHEIIVVAESEDLNMLQDISSKVKISLSHSGEKSIAEKLLISKGIDRILLNIKTYIRYKKIVKLIHHLDGDIILFTSMGASTFWLSLQSYNIKYAVSPINLRAIKYRNSLRFYLYFLFKRFIDKSAFTLVTEEVYAQMLRSISVKNVYTIPDRYLSLNSKVKTLYCKTEKTKFLTLGTISSDKSPISFLEEWVMIKGNIMQNIQYNIVGKNINTDLLFLEALIARVNNASYLNEYISPKEYDELMLQHDFVVIPYTTDYTMYATSGVMWDCFEKQKPMLCPNIEPFRSYVANYSIGYLYEYGKLAETIHKIITEKSIFFSNLESNYRKLISDYDKNSIFNRLERAFLES